MDRQWQYPDRHMTAREWNERNPVGTLVRYRPVSGNAEIVEAKTRSEAWDLPSGHAVVAIEGRAGGVALQALEVR